VNWGILGSALAFLISTSISHLLADYLLIKELNLSIKKFVKILITPLIATLIMSGGLMMFRCTIALDYNMRIYILIFAGVVLYTLTIGILGRITICNSISWRALKIWLKEI
jgi:hypothetical protein